MRADYPHRHSSAIFVSVQFWPEVVIRSPPIFAPTNMASSSLAPSPTITCFASPYGARTRSVRRTIFAEICDVNQSGLRGEKNTTNAANVDILHHRHSSDRRTDHFSQSNPPLLLPLFPIPESRCRIEIMQIKAVRSARMRSFVMGLHKSRRHQPPLPEVTTAEHYG